MEPLFDHTRDTFVPSDVRKDIHLSIRSLRDRETQDVQLMAWILLGSVLAVLLIACANVASLMMARGEARERELAVRSALGASRARLIRQTLTEATLLSLAGAAAGMALAEGLLRVFLGPRSHRDSVSSRGPAWILVSRSSRCCCRWFVERCSVCCLPCKRHAWLPWQRAPRNPANVLCCGEAW